jgi:hypothetical protein
MIKFMTIQAAAPSPLRGTYTAADIFCGDFCNFVRWRIEKIAQPIWTSVLAWVSSYLSGRTQIIHASAWLQLCMEPSSYCLAYHKVVF